MGVYFRGYWEGAKEGRKTRRLPIPKQGDEEKRRRKNHQVNFVKRKSVSSLGTYYHFDEFEKVGEKKKKKNFLGEKRRAKR